jgi:hypothetical protein
MKQRPMLDHAARFDRRNPHLCPALIWKSQFSQTPADPSALSTSDDHYWCVYTQTCIGPDNGPVEPYLCSIKNRSCRLKAIQMNR